MRGWAVSAVYRHRIAKLDHKRANILFVVFFTIAAMAISYAVYAVWFSHHQAYLDAGRSASVQGLEALSKGDFESAQSNLKRALESGAKNPGLHAALGQSYEATGRLGKAAAAYKESLSLKANQPQILYKLAIIDKHEGRIKESINGLESAIAVDQDFVAARLALAELYLQQGEPKKAKHNYQEVLELGPFGVDLQEVRQKLEGIK